jgi:hypothetical protein
MQIDWELCWQQLNALVPVLDAASGGNYTRVLLAAQEPMLDKRKTVTVRRALARFFRVDEQAAQQYGRQVLGRCQAVPVAYHPEVVLFPLWLRQAPVRDSGAYGYVNLVQLAELERFPGNLFRSRVVFRDGTAIDCLNTRKHIRQMMLMASRIKEDYLRFLGEMAPPGDRVQQDGAVWPACPAVCERAGCFGRAVPGVQTPGCRSDFRVPGRFNFRKRD